MTTASAAYATLKGLIEGAPPTRVGGRLRWQNDNGDPLPDIPAAFLYTEFLADAARVIEIGGGRGSNRHRNPARLECYAFVPRHEGLTGATDIAEQVASLFRSYKNNGITCESATVYPGGDGASMAPPGLRSEVGNYFWSLCVVDLYFDLIG